VYVQGVAWVQCMRRYVRVVKRSNRVAFEGFQQFSSIVCKYMRGGECGQD